jgi:hypothetical protein
MQSARCCVPASRKIEIFSSHPGLKPRPERLQQQPEPADADEDASRERQIIEDALAGSRGRVSDPSGLRRGSEYHLRIWSTAQKLRIRKSHFELS